MFCEQRSAFLCGHLLDPVKPQRREHAARGPANADVTTCATKSQGRKSQDEKDTDSAFKQGLQEIITGISWKWLLM